MVIYIGFYAYHRSSLANPACMCQAICFTAAVAGGRHDTETTAVFMLDVDGGYTPGQRVADQVTIRSPFGVHLACA